MKLDKVVIVLLVIFSFFQAFSFAQIHESSNIPHLLANLFGLSTSNSQSQSECDFHLTLSADSPQLVEPPLNYQPGTRCVWHLHAPDDFHARLQFEVMNLDCPASYLYIRTDDGSHGERYCQKPASSSLILGREAEIVFESSLLKSGSWFRIGALASAMNVEELFALPQIQSFTSLHYSSGYPNKHVQGWVIKNAIEGNVLVLDCRKGFHLEDAVRGSCDSDFLAVKVFDNARFQNNQKFCGRTGPGLIATKRKLGLVFRSDESNSFPGFICFYQSISQSEITFLYSVQGVGLIQLLAQSNAVTANGQML